MWLRRRKRCFKQFAALRHVSLRCARPPRNWRVTQAANPPLPWPAAVIRAYSTRHGCIAWPLHLQRPGGMPRRSHLKLAALGAELQEKRQQLEELRLRGAQVGTAEGEARLELRRLASVSAARSKTRLRMARRRALSAWEP